MTSSTCTALVHQRAEATGPDVVGPSLGSILEIPDREELLKEIEWLAMSALLGRNVVIAELLSIIVASARGARAHDLLDIIGTLRGGGVKHTLGLDEVRW